MASTSNTVAQTEGPINAGRPEDDLRAFRRALGQFATGVTVITAEADGQAVGLTANSFASVSLNPALILWSMDLNAKSRKVFESATHFAINILASDQIFLSNHFAKSGGDKFAGIEWQHGLGETPLLHGASCWLECKREMQYDGGDHIIVVGRVERFSVHDRPSLIFDKGRYGLAVDHPARVDTIPPEAGNERAPNEFFLGQLRRALGHVGESFDTERRATGLNVNATRVLSYLARYQHAPLGEMAAETFLGPADAKEALSTLLSEGLVVADAGDNYDITPAGHGKLKGLLARAVGFEKALFADIPQHEIDITRSVLKKITERSTASR